MADAVENALCPSDVCVRCGAVVIRPERDAVIQSCYVDTTGKLKHIYEGKRLDSRMKRYIVSMWVV
jgi:hypothetical protein